MLDWNYGPCAGSADAKDPHGQLYAELPWARPKELDHGKRQKNLAGSISFGQD